MNKELVLYLLYVKAGGKVTNFLYYFIILGLRKIKVQRVTGEGATNPHPSFINRCSIFLMIFFLLISIH